MNDYTVKEGGRQTSTICMIIGKEHIIFENDYS